jgi:uncharacterized membrane protein
LPPLWLPLLLSAVPLFEGRYAIPLAILWGLPAPLAYLLCTCVNLAVIPAVLLGMGTVVPPLRRRWRWVETLFRLMTRRRLRRRHFAALFTFVALPLPGTGAYTGTALAFLLGMRDGRTVATLALGVITANALTALTAGGLSWLL